MLQKICPHLGIGSNVPANQIFPRLGFEPGRSGRHKPFDIELVRINQETDERFLVIRFIGDVGEDEHPRFFLRARRAGERKNQDENRNWPFCLETVIARTDQTGSAAILKFQKRDPA